MNKPLPFTPEQFRHIAAAIEKLECDTLTAGQLKKLRKFLRKVFRGSVYADYRPDGTPIKAASYKLSAPDGTLVFRTKYLAELLDVSRWTIRRWIGWGVAAGVIDVTSCCDHTGSKRSVLEFRFSALTGSTTPYVESTKHPEESTVHPPNGIHAPTKGDPCTHQSASVHPSHKRNARESTFQPINSTTTSSGSSWSRLDSIRVESRLAAFGITKPRRCVEGARLRGYSPAEVMELCERSLPPRALAVHLLEGTELPRGRSPVRRQAKSPESIREDVVWRLRRSGVTDQLAIETAVTGALALHGLGSEVTR